MAKNKKKGNKQTKNPQVNNANAHVDDKLTLEETIAVEPIDNEYVALSTANNDTNEDITENIPDTTENDNNGINANPNTEGITKLEQEVRELKTKLEEERQKNETLKESNITPSDDSKNDGSADILKLKQERDHFEEQYNNLLSRISSMKSVFSKMKESQQELESTKEQLNEYESQNLKLKNKISNLNTESNELKTTVATLSKEFLNLENENESLQQKVSECETELRNKDSKLESTSHIYDSELNDLRDQNDKLSTQVQDLTSFLETYKQDMPAIINDKDELKVSLANSEQGKKELEEALEKLEKKIEDSENLYKDDLNQKDLEISALRVQLDTTVESDNMHKKEIETFQEKIQSLEDSVSEKEKLEKQAKDQALQIGKLRHEAIILNEHLKKALSMLKQSSDSETVDKELISNLLISFVSIPRGDSKKFEVLELLSSFLNWDADKKRQAGLLYDSEKSSTSVQPSSRTQSFVALWTEFLEKESEK